MRYLLLFAISFGATFLLSCTKEIDATPLSQGDNDAPSTLVEHETVHPEFYQFTVPKDCKIEKVSVVLEYKNVEGVSFNYVKCPKTKIVFSAQPDPFYAKTLSAAEVNDPNVSTVYLKKTTSIQSFSSPAFEIFHPYTVKNFHDYADRLPKYCKLSEVLLYPDNYQSPRTFKIVHTDKKLRPKLPKNASVEERKRHRINVKEALDHNWSCEETERIYFWFNQYIVSSTKNEIIDLTSVELLEK